MIGVPRFPDGELDLWPVVQDNMPTRPAVDTATKQACERRRRTLIAKLSAYVLDKGTSLVVTHRENVRIVGGRLLDIWSFAVQADGSTLVQVPRYALTTRPEVAQPMAFRLAVPAFLILGHMAHEAAHRDRDRDSPERLSRLYSGFRADNRHELDLSRVRNEELATDVDAYRILSAQGIPLTPADYADTVLEPQDYRQELTAKIGA